MSIRTLLLAATVLLTSTAAHAQAPKHEFRGAWIATVSNLDWPSRPGLSAEVQKTELRTLLDGLQAAGINAVVFQVRSESDAMYASPFEPWSYWLTGAQGTPPAPFYDPLEFAVAEAHQRGMELHAWINPYRADRGSNYPKAPTHVTNEHPEWILSFPVPRIKILDPGLPAVRDRVASIVGDIVRRYDIDGIHYDDYFYPYSDPETGFTGITNEDDATFAANSNGFTNRGDWRRDNVNRLVAQIQDTIRAVRPDVSHGVSPFGIWKSGIPDGTSGTSGYGALYADAVAWLNAQTVDYLVPQLYWSSKRSFDANGDGRLQFNNQRHTTLANWWGSVRNNRHLYTGLAAYRANDRGFGPDEIPFQIRFARASPEIDGVVLFRTKIGVLANGAGLTDSLKTKLYRTPALTPTMGWKSLEAPGQPLALRAGPTSAGGGVALAWDAPASGAARARFYAVYRLTSAEASNLPAALADPTNLVAVTGQTAYTDRGVANGEEVVYAVTAVSPNSVESAPSTTLRVTDSEATPATAERLALSAPYPNPTAGRTRLDLTLGAPETVSARVVDALGREIAVLLDAETLPAGPHALTWEPRRVGPGTYFVVVTGGGARAVRPVSVVR